VSTKEQRQFLAWDTNSARIQRAARLLKRREVMVICPNGHDHIVGELQEDTVIGSPCHWCKAPLTFRARGVR
jgi:hypothetical protein